MATERFGDLVTLKAPLSPASEAYRTLRMNLQYATLDRSMRSLLVTSAGPEEGKSTTLANLAVTIAQVEQRVIMVDCDLRRPRLHVLFGLDNAVGVSTMMLDDEMLANPPLLETGVDNLWLLPSGQLPPRPPDLLGSRRMDAVIDRLRERCDLLLFDAPPAVGVTDAMILATKVDAVLLVVSAGETRRDDAQSAIERLQNVNAHLVGTVLTNAPVSGSRGAYYQ
ncbi:MAG: CpsD/CapB family tyrosine-protein kinase [Anaerolineae bacterium]|jgi:capsular exopolysaccharide synthesis family protein